MVGVPTQASGPATGQGAARPAACQRVHFGLEGWVAGGEVLGAVVEGCVAGPGREAAGGHASAGAAALVDEVDGVAGGAEGGGAGEAGEAGADDGKRPGGKGPGGKGPGGKGPGGGVHPVIFAGFGGSVMRRWGG